MKTTHNAVSRVDIAMSCLCTGHDRHDIQMHIGIRITLGWASHTRYNITLILKHTVSTNRIIIIIITIIRETSGRHQRDRDRQSSTDDVAGRARPCIQDSPAKNFLQVAGGRFIYCTSFCFLWFYFSQFFYFLTVVGAFAVLSYPVRRHLICIT